MKRYLPFAIISSALLVSISAGTYLFRSHRAPQRPPPALAAGKAGAVPAHVRGAARASVMIEQFGDFECLPCFLLWPALKNIEKDYATNVSVTFREHPLPQHTRALEAARAAEAAGRQGRFWEMHDMLYLQRAKWVHADDVRPFFNSCASELALDVARFQKDLDGPEVGRRIADDQERGASFGIDRTPVLFINGRRVELQGQVEEGLRADINAALATKTR